jgi:hypothetical protein
MSAMPAPDDLLAILERIINYQHTDADLEVLRQALTVNRTQKVVQIGKYTVNIGQGQDIQIGDRIYNGADAETLKQVLQSLRLEVLNSDNAKVFPFKFKVLLEWIILDIISLGLGLAIYYIEENTSPIFVDFAQIVFAFINIFIAYCFYGFLGILIEAGTKHNWEFSEVKHSYIIWFFYPIISTVKIAWWIVKFILIFMFLMLMFRI